MEWLCTAHSGATSVSMKCNASLLGWLSKLFGRNNVSIKWDVRIKYSSFKSQRRRPTGPDMT